MTPFSSHSSSIFPRPGSDPIGTWVGPSADLLSDPLAQRDLLMDLAAPIFAAGSGDEFGLTSTGQAEIGGVAAGGDHPLFAYVPPCSMESLGDASFREDHGIRFAYVAGAMANGIASVDLIEAMARAEMLSFFGSAGLPLERVEASVHELKSRLERSAPFGFNLIHSPNEPDLETAIVELYLREEIRLVEASAFLRMTLPVVRYRTHGIHRDDSGAIVTPNRIIAKISRVEIATKFWSPPPEKMLRELVGSGELTETQAELASRIPVAQDLTAEADSGGHTDKRPAVALLPTMTALRDRLQAEHDYAAPLRVGLGGGISTPASAVAAFGMGAAFVVTGSINQSCVESGTSDLVRNMLADAGQADIAMAPAADMFEMGVQVQVLKRGTMFAMRGAKLYELYRRCDGLDDIPKKEREKLETTVFRAPLDQVWRETEAFFATRDPRQNERAEKNPKHKMALVFRWYLGQSSIWANAGVVDRKMDYQVWCGAAMGAFNEWVRGSAFESPKGRQVAEIAREILRGAAIMKRLDSLRSQGVNVPDSMDALRLETKGRDREAPELAGDLV